MRRRHIHGCASQSFALHEVHGVLPQPCSSLHSSQGPLLVSVFLMPAATHRRMVALARVLRIPDTLLVSLGERCPPLWSFEPPVLEATVQALAEVSWQAWESECLCS